MDLWPVLRHVATLTLLGDPDKLEERAAWAEAAGRPYAPDIRRDADAAREAAAELAFYKARPEGEGIKFEKGTEGRGADVNWRTLVVGIAWERMRPYYVERTGNNETAPQELREWIAIVLEGILPPGELDPRSGRSIESAITSWRQHRDSYRPIIDRVGALWRDGSPVRLAFTPERVNAIIEQVEAEIGDEGRDDENPN